MKTDNRKYFLYFSITITLFLGLVVYATIIYFGWSKTLKPQDYSVEVSLPLIDWDKYSQLAKTGSR